MNFFGNYDIREIFVVYLYCCNIILFKRDLKVKKKLILILCFLMIRMVDNIFWIW